MPGFLQRTRLLCYVLMVVLSVPHIAAASVRAEDPIKVQNVRFEITGSKVLVHYDLDGPSDGEYLVKLVLKREQSQTFLHFPKSVVGDVGEGSFAGIDRKINWDLLKDFSQGLEGNDFYFVVEAELVSKGVSFLWYLGGGAVVVGSAAAYFLSKSSKSDAAPTAGFPLPIGRPSGN